VEEKKLGSTQVDVVEEKKEEKLEFKDLEQMSEEEQMAQILKHINAQRGQQPGGQPMEKEKSAKLTLWKNGFQINDGEFMSLDKPENKKMLEEINNGTVPLEIRKIIGPAMQYAFSLEPKEENYSPPKQSFKAFGTEGRSLGNTSTTPVFVEKPQVKTNVDPGYTVDENSKVVNVQIRLSDGTVLKARFNLEHTVGTIKTYIRNTTGLLNFTISTTFPRREYSVDDETIGKAGLANSAVNVISKSN